MYEITVIEHVPSGHTLMTHVPCSDDSIEVVSSSIIGSEEECVEQGILIAYSTFTVYTPDNQCPSYTVPPTIVVGFES